MRYALYNPLSTKSLSKEQLEVKLKEIDSTKQYEFIDVTTVTDRKAFFDNLKESDDVVICGGDGTLNKMVNSYDFENFRHDIYLYKSGNGNDFLRDVNQFKQDFILLNPYIVNLPKVTVNGETYKFLNGVGFGIDGMVCVVSDKMKAEGKKDINYTTLSIKLLLTKYKRVNCKVTVDGTSYEFKNVYLASTMNGQYYGGGMLAAPSQDRLSSEVTVCIWHDFNNLTALMAFPSIFKGEHVKKVKKVTVLKGKEVYVEFDKPTALQIDGESFDNIISYKVVK